MFSHQRRPTGRIPANLSSSGYVRSPMGSALGGRLASLLLCSALWSVPAMAGAQYDELGDGRRSFESPELFALELRGGPYQPDAGPAFGAVFDDDRGPLLALEVDILPIRLKDVLAFGLGLGIGWARYTGDACLDPECLTQGSEQTRLTLVPLSAMAVLRFDLLARKLDIPFIFTGKLGVDRVSWSTSTGAAPSTSGWSTGLRMAAQVALDLNFFDRRAARNLDEEWGINRTFLFFEVLRSETLSDEDLQVGDTTWAVGLGFGF
jgi:hypothetical protein